MFGESKDDGKFAGGWWVCNAGLIVVESVEWMGSSRSARVKGRGQRAEGRRQPLYMETQSLPRCRGQ
jgi:hypothetical protein